jgi:hypothetical protein
MNIENENGNRPPGTLWMPAKVKSSRALERDGGPPAA